MRRLLLSCLLGMGISICSHATTIIVNNSGSRANGEFADFASAHTAAADGDTIYVVPSTVSYGSHTITKSLRIYGVGFNPVSHNRLTSNFGQLTLSDNTDNTFLSGLFIENGILINTTAGVTQLSNITISGCYVGEEIFLSDLDTQLNGFYIEGCIIGSDIETASTISIDLNNANHMGNDVNIRGCVIYGNTDDPAVGAVSTNNTNIDNNIFVGAVGDINHIAFGDLQDCFVFNNIFYRTSPSNDGSTFSGNIFANNYAFETLFDFTDTEVIGGNSTSSPINMNGVDPLFVNLPPTDSWSNDYDVSLQNGSPAAASSPYAGVFTGSVEFFNQWGTTLSFIASDTVDNQVFNLESLNASLHFVSPDSSDIDNMEYFFDGNDPGVGMATILTVSDVTPAFFNTSIPTSALSPGVHTLHVRVNDDNTFLWSIPQVFTFYISERALGGNLIDQVEYFIDDDPGIGSGNIIPISSGMTISTTEALTDPLLSTPGLHNLYVRARLDNGQWGLVESRLLYVDESGIGAKIDRLEYFFDDDPGYGAGTEIDISSVGDSTLFSIMESVDGNTLTPGFHNLFVRTRLQGGQWAIPETRALFVDPSTGVSKIETLEYFFDDDPGFGAGTAIDLTTLVGDSTAFTISEMASTALLSEGLHTLYLRGKEEGGNWGAVESRLIYVDPATSLTQIENLEYFFDDDPGFGAGTTIDLSMLVGDSSNFTISEMASTATLDIGFHVLYTRAQRKSGNWGPLQSTLIYVDQSGPSIANIDQIEIFFDNDPGYGAAEIIDLPLPGPNILLDSTLTPDRFPQTPGTYMMYARARTEEGTWGLLDTAIVIVEEDIDPPTATIDDLTTASDSPELTGTIDDNNASISIVIDGLTYGADNNQDGTWTLAAGQIASLSEGQFDVQIIATDLANNEFDQTFVNAVTVDVTTPVATINTIVTNQDSPGLSGNLDDNEATISVTIDGQTYAANNNQDGTWTLMAGQIVTLAEGQYDVQLTAIDLVGNEFDQTFANAVTIDMTLPTVGIDSVVTNEISPMLTGTIDDTEASISVTIDGQTYNATNNQDGTWTLAAGTISSLTDGFYDVQLMATNIADNTTDQLFENAVLVDASNPTATINPLLTNMVSPALTGTIDEDEAVIEISVDGQNHFATNNRDGSWVLPAGTIIDLASGVYDIQVMATDTALNLFDNTFSSVLEIDLDLVAITIDDIPVVQGTHPEISGQVDDNQAIVAITLGSDTFSATVSADGQWSVTSTDVPVQNAAGTFPFTVEATDLAGNQSMAAANLVVVSEIDISFDSLVLVRIFDETGGQNWTDNTNWKEVGLSPDQWAGVTVTDNRVTGLSLGSNNLTGTFPALLATELDGLQTLDISDNSLMNIPDFTGQDALSSLDVSQNALEFDDLVPNIAIENFTYNDQQAVGQNIEQFVQVGNSVSFISTVSGDIDTYQWKKNGENIETATNETYTFTVESASAGTYSCETQNNNLPGLTINFLAGNLVPVVNLSGNVVDQSNNSSLSNVEVFLLSTAAPTEGFGFDTVQTVNTDGSGDYLFEDVLTGEYLIAVRADTAVFMGTYFGNVIAFEGATTVMAIDNLENIDISVLRKPTISLSGDNLIRGTLEEEIPDDPGARIEARRRVRLAGVSLYRSKTRLRSNSVDLNEWDLIAYTQTDDDGNFNFGDLEDAVYLIQIEFPGVPLDDNAVVEFDLRNDGIEEQEIELSAVIDDGVISVEQLNVTGIHIHYFKNLNVFPIPSKNEAFIRYDKLIRDGVSLHVTDIRGNTIFTEDMNRGGRAEMKIDLSNLLEGMYFFRFVHEGVTVLSIKVPKK